MENINEKLNKCLNCKSKPCTKACPLENNIPEIIKLVKEEKIHEAYDELTKTTVLPSICGRICPHMSQCMGKCIKGIKETPVSIGEIETYLGDTAIKNNWKLSCSNQNQHKKIAIIGSGPAGLTCAAFLARNGFDVTIYEKHEKLGGILRYGIPDFRLDKQILDNTIKQILQLNINVEYKKELGKNLELQDLIEKYDFIYIAIGANIPWKMGIKGEELQGVYGGNTLLENKQFPQMKEKVVAIIGGGNVAIDCARTAKRLGAKAVKIIYRRDKEQMPAEENEIIEAKKDGVEFLYKNNILQILGNEKVEKIECIKTELIQKEGESRLVPQNIENSNYLINVDYVIMAIGAQTQKQVLTNSGIEINEKGYIKVDENYKTSIKKVYAGGDVVGTKATVAWAAKNGRKMAETVEKSMNL